MTISPGNTPTQWASIESVRGAGGYETSTEAYVVAAVGVFLRTTVRTPEGTMMAVTWAAGVKTSTNGTTGITSLVTI